MDVNIIAGIIAGVAGLLTTALGWLLNQMGLARQAKELEILKSRLEVIEKLSELKETSEVLQNDIEKQRKLEIRAVLAEISEFTEIANTRASSSNDKINWWNKIILGYSQISLKGRIYKGLFRAFAILALLVWLSITSILNDEYEGSNLWITVLVGGIIYLMIGLGFRRAAIRTYTNDKKKVEAAQKEN